MSDTYISPQGTAWSALRKEVFTSVEIAESDVRVKIISKLIEARDTQGLSQRAPAENEFTKKARTIVHSKDSTQRIQLDILTKYLSISKEQLWVLANDCAGGLYLGNKCLKEDTLEAGFLTPTFEEFQNELVKYSVAIHDIKQWFAQVNIAEPAKPEYREQWEALVKGTSQQSAPLSNREEERQQSHETKKTRKPRLPVKQKIVADLCGVSVSIVKKWEAGKYTPPGYPGRHCLAQVKAFAESYKLKKSITRVGEKLRKAVMGQDMSKHSTSYFDD